MRVALEAHGEGLAPVPIEHDKRKTAPGGMVAPGSIVSTGPSMPRSLVRQVGRRVTQGSPKVATSLSAMKLLVMTPVGQNCNVLVPGQAASNPSR